MQKNNYENFTDTELLEKYYSTNTIDLIGILLQRYTLLLFGTCMKYLKDETKSKDAVQQIFLKVLNELPKYKVTFFKSWIYMIAKNHCLMLLRNKTEFKSLENFEIENDFELDKDELIIKEQDFEFLELSIKELNVEQQNCIQQFYILKKSYAEISKTTGYNLMQVKSHIQNGKRNLKILITQKREQ